MGDELLNHSQTSTLAPSKFGDEYVISIYNGRNYLFTLRLKLTHVSKGGPCFLCHYCDVIMGTMASQITSLTIVYSIVYSGADQRKHQSSASLGPVNSPHKWPVTRKMFPFDDVIMKEILGVLRWACRVASLLYLGFLRQQHNDNIPQGAISSTRLLLHRTSSRCSAWLKSREISFV